MPALIDVVATALLVIAILHTFCVPIFSRLAHRPGPHAGLYHLLSEVEAVFGIWAFVLIVCLAALQDSATALQYVDTRDFTEPLFVFAIMLVAASRPILDLVGRLLRGVARLLPMPVAHATCFAVLCLVPLAGSIVTEPAAMTLAALLLRDSYFNHSQDLRFKYVAFGVLLVNISIGGVLTAYAAPPVLLVVGPFNWDSAYMATHFGWRAALAVVINSSVLTWTFRRSIAQAWHGAPTTPAEQARETRRRVPWTVIGIHLVFLAAVVLFSHHPAAFIGVLLLFVGFTQAYARFQSPLMFREALMVGFFLAGLVVLGGMQKWWLQDLLGSMPPTALFWGAAALTAFTDNAALTYLGSLVDGTSEAWRYMLVAGAVTGGGLTVIANAPNPAGFAILAHAFPDGRIAAGRLLRSVLLPTLVAAVFFLLPV